MTIRSGSWLGIDVGSARAKVCGFCLIESDGADGVTVRFEQGPAATTHMSKARARVIATT